MNGISTLGRAGVIGMAAGALISLAGCVVVVGNTTHHYDEEWYDRTTGEKPRTIGIVTEPVGRALASQIGVDADKCTLITEVLSGRPAEKAGLKPYDVITQIDGVADAPPGRLREVIRAKSPGDEVKLHIIRNGQQLDIAVPMEKVESKGYSG